MNSYIFIPLSLYIYIYIYSWMYLFPGKTAHMNVLIKFLLCVNAREATRIYNLNRWGRGLCHSACGRIIMQSSSLTSYTRIMRCASQYSHIYRQYIDCLFNDPPPLNSREHRKRHRLRMLDGEITHAYIYIYIYVYIHTFPHEHICLLMCIYDACRHT